MNFKDAMTSVLAFSFLGLSACSSLYKQRQAEREKVAQSSGLYCEFVNGDDHNDVDVELNLQMARKCDTSKHYSVTNYKNASDIFGVIYCCASNKSAVKSSSKQSPATNSKDKKSDEVIAD